jgi:hypothetical protein
MVPPEDEEDRPLPLNSRMLREFEDKPAPPLRVVDKDLVKPPCEFPPEEKLRIWRPDPLESAPWPRLLKPLPTERRFCRPRTEAARDVMPSARLMLGRIFG